MQKVLVLGKGKSGMAAQKVAQKDGFATVLVDDSDQVYEESELSSFSFAVASPGFSPQNKWVLACQKANLKLVSELDFGLSHLRGKQVVAVTGTNGKTTTVMLIAELLKTQGKIFLLGNIGTPLCEKVLKIGEDDFVVLEVSSFMLAQSKLLRPKVAVLLNISPDHIEWHGSAENYVISKLNIFENQTESDFSVLWADDPCHQEWKTRAKGKLLCFSTAQRCCGAYIEGGNIIFDDGHIHELVAYTQDIKLCGDHNIQNILASVCVAKSLGVSSADIKKVLKNFDAPSHRICPVGRVKGILFVNDSKSTNPNSTCVAVDALKGKPITLLVGGYNKKLETAEMFAKISKKVKNVVCYGECGPEFCEQAKQSGCKKVFLEEDLKSAFVRATKCSKKGNVVLLSPATSSFDEFQNYEERGRAFEQLVKDFETKTNKTNPKKSSKF